MSSEGDKMLAVGISDQLYTGITRELEITLDDIKKYFDLVERVERRVDPLVEADDKFQLGEMINAIKLLIDKEMNMFDSIQARIYKLMSAYEEVLKAEFLAKYDERYKKILERENAEAKAEAERQKVTDNEDKVPF